MIPIDVEEKVRKKLRKGDNQEDIARELKVGTKTVGRIQKVLKRVESLACKNYCPGGDRYELVVILLKNGVAVSLIEDALGLGREYVIAVRRHAYLHRRTSTVEQPCPTCGNMMLKRPDGDCDVNGRYLRSDAVEKRMWDSILCLEDLESLGALKIISHPLFCDLAKQATELLNKVEELSNG